MSRRSRLRSQASSLKPQAFFHTGDQQAGWGERGETHRLSSRGIHHWRFLRSSARSHCVSHAKAICAREASSSTRRSAQNARETFGVAARAGGDSGPICPLGGHFARARAHMRPLMGERRSCDPHALTCFHPGTAGAATMPALFGFWPVPLSRTEECARATTMFFRSLKRSRIATQQTIRRNA